MFVTKPNLYFSKSLFFGFVFFHNKNNTMLQGKNLLKANVLFQILCGVKTSIAKMSYYELNVLARTVGNALFDMTPTWSGFKSQGLLDAEQQNPKTKKCAEHFYPRQVSGWRIVEHLIQYRGISKKKLFEMISVFIKVHYTTSEENTRLVPYQKVGVFISPEHSYQMANITLVKVKD